MPRPTTRPRLASLDPSALAADVDERLTRYLSRLAVPLSPGLEVRLIRPGGDMAQSDMALTAEALCHYAQRGLPVWDWETHGEAMDAVQNVVSTMYGCPADTSSVGPLAEDGLDEADLDDPLALVLVAAWARAQLASGESLTVCQLGALAGLDPSVIRKMNKDCEIFLTGLRPCVADAAEARRWLGSRGVKGL